MINISNLFVTVNKGSLHEKMILKQVNLSVRDGEFVVLGGNNGSGKSVLFDIICGNLRHDIGIVSLDFSQDGDYDTDIEYIRSDINYSIANTETFIENIFLNHLNKKSMLGFINRKSAYAEIEKYIRSFCFGEDIDKMLYKSFKELPKHYEHILVLLIAAVNKPRLILIDDIFSGLDEAETKSILDIINKIHSKQKCTMIISTCNPYTAAKLQGRKIIISNGSIVKDTVTSKVMDHREVVDLFNQHLKFAYEKDCVLISGDEDSVTEYDAKDSSDDYCDQDKMDRHNENTLKKKRVSENNSKKLTKKLNKSVSADISSVNEVNHDKKYKKSNVKKKIIDTNKKIGQEESTENTEV